MENESSADLGPTVLEKSCVDAQTGQKRCTLMSVLGWKRFSRSGQLWAVDSSVEVISKSLQPCFLGPPIPGQDAVTQGLLLHSKLGGVMNGVVPPLPHIGQQWNLPTASLALPH